MEPSPVGMAETRLALDDRIDAGADGKRRGL
jgi:hypothetical protein